MSARLEGARTPVERVQASMKAQTDAIIHPKIMELVAERGWRGLTPIQQEAAKHIMAGANVLVVAPTGEGKTEAALFPIFTLMLESPPRPVTLLYITPMKALINDLYERIKWWASRLGFRVARKHGDTPSKERSARLRRVPHILITTPESLEVDLDWSPSFRRYYQNLKFVVVDEVHEFIGTKRGAQLLILLERLKRLSGVDFQRVGLSATIPDAEHVLRVLSGSSKRPRRLVQGGSRSIRLKVRYLDTKSAGDVWVASARIVLEEIEPPSLVFVNSRYVAEKIKEAMEQLGVNDVFVHHSSVSADVREEAEAKLKRGELRAIVCTKTLEVGIDVGEIRKVVQYRAPGSVASLIQRVGRSGHALGATPKGAIVAVGPVDFLEALAEADLAVEGRIDSQVRGRLIPLDVAAKEIVGMALQKSVTPDEAIDIILSAAPEPGVTKQDLEELLGYLVRNRLVKIEDGVLKPGPTFYKIWRFQGADSRIWWSRNFTEFFSTIMERDTFTIWHGDRHIGNVDSLFVYRYLRVGDAIRLAGRTWRVKSIDAYNSRVEVEPASDLAETPLWKGEGPRRSPIVAERAAEILAGAVVGEVEADEAGIRAIEDMRREYARRRVGLPGVRRVIYEDYVNEHIFTVFLGDGAAEALAMVLAFLASKEAGMNVHYRSSYYGFSVYAPGVDVLKILHSIDPDEFPALVEKAVERSPYLAQVMRSLQVNLGQLEKPGEEDELLIKEAKRQVIETYLDVEGAVRFLRDLREGRVVIETPLGGGLTPLALEVLSLPATKPWVPDLAERIANLLKGNPLTVDEIADLLDLSPKTVEAKLKEMRKPDYGELRVTSFIDVDEDEARWALVNDLEDIAQSEEFSASFRPPQPRLPLRVTFTGDTSGEVVITPDSLNDDVLFMFPDEIKKLVIRPAHADNYYIDDVKVVYYYVPKRILRLMILNAATYIGSRATW